MAKKIPATSKDVRRWFEDNPDKVPAGAEISVQVSCKGRIKPEAIKAFNSASGMQYVEGNEPHETVEFVHPETQRKRRVTMPRSQARKYAGKHAGTRGPLSATALSKAGERYARKLAKSL